MRMARVMSSSRRWFPLVSSSPTRPLFLARRCCRTNILSTLPAAPLLSIPNTAAASSTSFSPTPLIAGVADEDAFADFVSGRRTRLTDLAHGVWRKYVGEGDVVVDATCGNGHDTLALLGMVAPPHQHKHKHDEPPLSRPLVYAMDIQESALTSTSTLLGASAAPAQRQLVELFLHCHSRMEDVLPTNISPRLIAFNLGYLPGGDKSIITRPTTTLPALEAASRLVASGGLISLMVYVGHPGGMDELEVVEAFASKLSTNLWNCCKFENMNRPASPVLIFLYKK